jgi:hypothetical protein
VAKLFIKLTGKRGFVIVAGVVAAALCAKGHGQSPFGMFDGH